MTSITSTQQWPLTTSPATRSRALTVALWIVSVAATALFLMAGWGKLSGAPQMVQLFDLVGGQWFRYVTGGIELVAAIALVIPAIALFGALALAMTMIGAVITHLVILGDSPAVPLVLLVALSFIAWTRWRER